MLEHQVVDTVARKDTKEQEEQREEQERKDREEELVMTVMRLSERVGDQDQDNGIQPLKTSVTHSLCTIKFKL